MPNKILILTSKIDMTNKVLEMLYAAGFEWSDHGYGPNQEYFKNDCAGIQVNYNGVIGTLDWISRNGSKDFDDNKDWVITMDYAITPERIQSFNGAKPIKKEIMIDAAWLLEHKACEDGFKWFVEKYGKSKVSTETVFGDLNKANLYSYGVWLEDEIKDIQEADKDFRDELLNENRIRFMDMSQKAKDFMEKNWNFTQESYGDWIKNTVLFRYMQCSAYRIDPDHLDKLLRG